MAENLKPLATALANLLKMPATQNVKQELQDRMTLSEAIDAAGAIIDRFPNGGRAAGDGYIGALASTLMAYPRGVARRCADFPVKPGQPLRGVCAAAEFMPVPANLIAWCEREAEPLWRKAEWERNGAEAMALREATCCGPRLSYDELKAKYGDWGTVPAAARYGLSADDLIAICGADVWATIPDAKV
jgi:hypothetical protein